jgi:hypothetical protein
VLQLILEQIKYADNVAKGFALSASVVLTVLVCIAFFHYQLTWAVVAGTLTVTLATYAFENGVKGWLNWLPGMGSREAQYKDLETAVAMTEKA